VKMRCVVRGAGFHEHTDDDAEEPADLWHSVIILVVGEAGGLRTRSSAWISASGHRARLSCDTECDITPDVWLRFSCMCTALQT
jgi:hypothetical protein